MDLAGSHITGQKPWPSTHPLMSPKVGALLGRPWHPLISEGHLPSQRAFVRRLTAVCTAAGRPATEAPPARPAGSKDRVLLLHLSGLVYTQTWPSAHTLQMKGEGPTWSAHTACPSPAQVNSETKPHHVPRITWGQSPPQAQVTRENPPYALDSMGTETTHRHR